MEIKMETKIETKTEIKMEIKIETKMEIKMEIKMETKIEIKKEINKKRTFQTETGIGTKISHYENVCSNKISYVNIGFMVVLKSPNYPGNYPPNLNCTWSISAVRNDQRVRIVFLSLNIDSRGDKLNIYGM